MSSTTLALMSADATFDSTDAEGRWIRASLSGDSEAYGALVRRHQERVFHLAGRFFRRREEVEEVAQETFLRAWLKLGTYRSEAPFEHWLTRLCLRCAYDRLRREPPPADPLPARELEQEAHDPTARIEVERLLARLAPSDRFLLTLLEGEGWSVAEIARRLGWTQVNVKVRAHRVRKKLRRILESGRHHDL